MPEDKNNSKDKKEENKTKKDNRKAGGGPEYRLKSAKPEGRGPPQTTPPYQKPLPRPK